MFNYRHAAKGVGTHEETDHAGYYSTGKVRNVGLTTGKVNYQQVELVHRSKKSGRIGTQKKKTVSSFINILYPTPFTTPATEWGQVGKPVSKIHFSHL